MNVFGFLLNFSASWKTGEKEQWPKKSLFQLFRLNVVICHLRPKRGWNIFESLKSCQMTESAKDKQSWICFQFLMHKSRALAVNSQSWTFETNICGFMPFVDTNSHLKTKPTNFDIKKYCNSESYDQHNFFGPSLGLVRIFHLRLEVFSTRESTLKLTAQTFSWRDSQVEN